MPDWSIKIIATPGGGAALQPDLVDAKPGDPLEVQEDDLISWNNTTNQQYQPWPTDSNFVPLPDDKVSMANDNYLSDPIPANRSSTPVYDVVMPTSGDTIYYCLKNTNVRGTIVVSAMPTALNVPKISG